MREAGFLARSETRRVTRGSTRHERRGEKGEKGKGEKGEGEETFFVSREMVEEVAREWGVKKMMMEVEYVKM